ncbi:unnamed protein product [Ceratitis capitata]|uniref:(Mediterranean fruit fly) hypothetical protein n=1 Tax=Ceratitis capitata TaxID=7213 RepID=A0A811UQK2_CERCA|nr:unnamed protein product [Ceratitis capitata]
MFAANTPFVILVAVTSLTLSGLDEPDNVTLKSRYDCSNHLQLQVWADESSSRRCLAVGITIVYSSGLGGDVPAHNRSQEIIRHLATSSALLGGRSDPASHQQPVEPICPDYAHKIPSERASK